MGFKRKGVFFVYIIQCIDGSYYTGYTNDLERRIKEHNRGKGSKYVRGKRPVTLVYARSYGYYKNALRGEREIKKLERKKKEDLVKSYANINF